MKLNEAETLYMFGLVRYDLEELYRRETRLRLRKRLANDICLDDLREKAKE